MILRKILTSFDCGYKLIESTKLKKKMLRLYGPAYIKVQKEKVDKWIDYLASDDSSNLPLKCKLEIFNSIVANISKSSNSGLPILNEEMLQIYYDSQVESSKPCSNFINEYTKKIQSYKKITLNESLSVADGLWVVYKSIKEGGKLTQSLSGFSTGWAFCGKNYTISKIKSGMVYVYYLQDETEGYRVPCSLIYTKNNSVATTLINDFYNNDAIKDVVIKKLLEFNSPKSFRKWLLDDKRLERIGQKIKQGRSVQKKDLAFILQINRPFGHPYNIRNLGIYKRWLIGNLSKNLTYIFQCKKEQISQNTNSISLKTKVYIGKLKRNIFRLLPQTIKHIYTTFPQDKIFKKEIVLQKISNREIMQKYISHNIKVDKTVNDFLRKNNQEDIRQNYQFSIVQIRVEQLGLMYPTTERLYSKANSLGLTLCSASMGFYIRLNYLEQPIDTWSYIGMKQVEDGNLTRGIFVLGHYQDGLHLTSEWADPKLKWGPRCSFIFSV
jgi:hypothetical protein